MFFLIDFSYKQGLGIYTRLLSSVIPACARMTAEVSAKIAPPFFRRLFALFLLQFFCRRSDSQIRHFPTAFFRKR